MSDKLPWEKTDYLPRICLLCGDWTDTQEQQDAHLATREHRKNQRKYLDSQRNRFQKPLLTLLRKLGLR